jgi:hypothetical protein
VGVGLEEGECFRSDFADLDQEVSVADLAQALNLLLAVETGEVVLLLGVDAGNVAANGVG